MRLTLRMLTGIALFAGAMTATAATMNITASFAPSMDNPENNSFINTTPQSGFCLSLPQQCKENKIVSIHMNLNAKLTAPGFTANAPARKSMYFKVPGAWRNVVVTNGEGEQATVQFRVSTLSAQYSTYSVWSLAQHRQFWKGGSFFYAPSPCSILGWGVYGWLYYHFIWKWPASDSACYKIPTIDMRKEPHSINNIGIGYELKTPDPLKMGSGKYTGTLKLSAGSGGDFDFGDNFSVNDSNVYFAFTLSVNHELKLTTTADDQNVFLQPCATGKVCTEDGGKANWERWMITRITPQLTGRSNFSLSSSGAFTVYLECEQQSGSDCGLKSDNNPSQLVPVQALLTLPDNIVDNSTGSTVSKRRLAVGRDLQRNIFATNTFGQNKNGSIDFLVSQRDVDTMLKTRPDTYRGAVTLIFDPKIN